MSLNEVMVDMVYGEANENSMEADRIYHERFPNRHRMFTHNRLYIVVCVKIEVSTWAGGVAGQEQ